jgi:hypothetical protein
VHSQPQDNKERRGCKLRSGVNWQGALKQKKKKKKKKKGGGGGIK